MAFEIARLLRWKQRSTCSCQLNSASSQEPRTGTRHLTSSCDSPFWDPPHAALGSSVLSFALSPFSLCSVPFVAASPPALRRAVESAADAVTQTTQCRGIEFLHPRLDGYPGPVQGSGSCRHVYNTASIHAALSAATGCFDRHPSPLPCLRVAWPRFTRTPLQQCPEMAHAVWLAEGLDVSSEEPFP